ncbi:dermonecrotic toxin domain-containing protein [Pseudomonas sp. NFACC07-1]|uniref:dermonecrotic toxin domain-containing protein n=1 Tax=Pseudomonas sp. NFACC07-1 TaxID=1566239 RepID=UPI0008C091EA|nr:DUF6543 domain-containing protein [Pseudomonas sp. NFACC07-1]SEJ75465.1 hypothetical protein SAMN03159298_04281 [Pseudomonas sp. NFACC07-1]
MLENTPLQTASALLIHQLNASQQQMIRLNDAVPRASEVAARHLDNGFRQAFPTLVNKLAVKEIRVCRLQDEAVPPTERAANAPAFKKVAQTVPLDTLFWRAVAGKINAHEFFDDLGNIDIVTELNSVTEMPAALNSRDAKQAIKQLISVTPTSYEQMLARALDNFWDTPPDVSQDRSVSQWLADEFGRQLKAQADLHQLDGTLSPPLHKALTEHALSAPDATSRARLAERDRPGVYSLSITPEGWGFSVPVSGAVALTRHDNTDYPASAVLYSLGKPLEVYADLTALKASLEADDNVQYDVTIAPIAGDFLAYLVMDLRAAQKTAVSDVLLNGPGDDEQISAWIARLDIAANLKDQLDLAGAMDERALRLYQKKLDDWLHANPNVIGSDRVAWWNALQDLQITLADTPPPPDPVMLASPDALQDRTRTLLAGFIKDKYAPVDPDQVSLCIRKQTIDSHAPTGESPFGSGVSLGSAKAIFDDCRSMTQWAMSNLTPDERNASHHTEEGPLSFAQIVEIIERANVGARIPPALLLAARERQAQWMALKAKQMRAQAWAAHISGDFTHDKDNTGLNLVLAALDSAMPEERRKVNGHEVVVVRQIQWGDSVLKELLAFGVRKLSSRPSLTLYTPGAPDGKVFRDIHAGSERELEAVLVKTLISTLEMTRWLISQLPLMEQADQLASLVPAAENLTLNEKIKKVTQSTFSWIKHRVQDDFALKVASPVVKGDLLKALHETQISHALKTADALMVTNAERDSAAAQEGRRNGVTLLVGAMAMFYAGRLGGVLGRAILPVMAGGAAVSAIKDEGGSFSQWASDFISGLGEVVAEAGQDLIMARAARRRDKTRPELSSLPRMPDPELGPFLLKGFDSKGLVPEGRNLYRDASGQAYLKMGHDYCKTAIQESLRIIYAPNNRTHQRTVTWKNGRWHIEEPQRLLGGGVLHSLFSRAPETAQQKTYNALVEGILVDHHWPSRQVVNTVKKVIHSMPEELAERTLRESMNDIDVPDIDTYLSRINQINKGLHGLGQHKKPHESLLYKFNVWQAVDYCTRDIDSQVKGIQLTAAQKIKVFDMTLPLKKELFDNEGNFKMMMSSLPDNLTGALFITIVPEQGKKKAAMTKIQDDIHEVVKVAEKRVWEDLGVRFSGEGPEVEAAREDYKTNPANFAEYKKKKLGAFRDEMKKRHKPGLLTEIRNNKIPYVIANKGKSQRKTLLVTGEDITNFAKKLSNYDAFDIEVVTQVPTKKVTGTSPTTSTSPVLGEASTAIDKFTVTLSTLAETQMSYDNFPEAARAKINEIMDDIRAGRATTKRINKYYWYDMAQLSPGGGRSAWRAAFERKGDTWILQGFYDYHANKPATVW